MQTLNERHYRVTRAQVHIFQTVLSALEAHPDDDVPEPSWRNYVDSIRGQLHDLESDLASALTGLPGMSESGIQSGGCNLR